MLKWKKLFQSRRKGLSWCIVVCNPINDVAEKLLGLYFCVWKCLSLEVKTVARKKNINLIPEKTAIFLGNVYYPESTQNAGFYMPPDPSSNVHGTTSCTRASKRQKGLAQFFFNSQRTTVWNLISNPVWNVNIYM